MTNDPLDFSGKVALVTGAASGMGLATAQAFAEAGAAVVLADFKEDAVKAAAHTLVAAGHKALAVRCDVSDDAQVGAMVERTVAEFGRLDAASVGERLQCRKLSATGLGRVITRRVSSASREDTAARRFAIWAVAEAKAKGSHAWSAAISGLMPTMFMTRVRL